MNALPFSPTYSEEERQELKQMLANTPTETLLKWLKDAGEVYNKAQEAAYNIGQDQNFFRRLFKNLFEEPVDVANTTFGRQVDASLSVCDSIRKELARRGVNPNEDKK